jgi:intein-encoded DNA endonuclease-like protein
MKTTFTDKQINNAKLIYEKNNSLRKTSKILNMSRSTLTRIFKENNIKINKPYIAKKPKFIESFFESINSQEKAYWLGFLYADGYLNIKENKLRIELNVKDLNHLILFCQTLKYPINRIKYRKNKNTNWISICSKKMSEDLQKLNFKSENMDINFIPVNLRNSFIRGLYDGDGSIYHQGKKSLGTGLILKKEWVQSVLSEIPDINIKVRPVAKTKPKGMYRIETYNLQSSINLCNYLYHNSVIHLNRKYDKYLSRVL